MSHLPHLFLAAATALLRWRPRRPLAHPSQGPPPAPRPPVPAGLLTEQWHRAHGPH